MKLKFLLLIFMLLFLINNSYAVESNSTNFISNSYIGSGGITTNISSINSSLGFGQVMIGNINDTLYEGIFYISKDNITIITYNCSSSNLTLCTNSTACISFGGYWYNNYCHPSPQSGGGTGGGSSGTIKYIIYPTTFYSTVIQYQAVYKTFYIENHESSSPLIIQIESGKFAISPTHFTIAPGRRAEVDFTIFGSNKSGYINDTLTINIMKTSLNQKQENITINYYVKNTTIINITEEEKNITEKNATVIDLLPFIKKQPELKADLSRAVRAIDDFIKHPMFITVIISLLIIVVIVIQQMSEKSELGESFENIKASPLFYIIIGTFALFIGALILFYSKMDYFWAKVRIMYTHPAFLLIVFSILLVLLIIISQLKRTDNNRFKWGKLALILVISGLFILIIRNAGIIGKFLYKYPYFYKSPIFFIICVSIIVIILLVLYQIHKKNS